ncbi:hypothetical protein [Dyella telluris]|uniref:Uncharacterized protein n=1 Tax=Dyella telluris TaxID=2763498 RepID=A0A7G8Q3A4_9GAMM|nr:hypothetical protein [Dyella telluris]QNK01262.1 hypothetical protein H8F01_19785 [Dyella telluris]
MLIALTIALALFGAAGIGAAVADHLWRRRVESDPLFTPPNQDVADFAEECRRHARIYIIGARPSAQRPELPLASINPQTNSVLRLLGELNCVVPIRRGVAQLPGSLTADLRRGADIEKALAGAYVSLGEASSIITHHVITHYNVSDLEHSPYPILRSITGLGARYPMETELAGLAALLGADPNREDGAVGGNRLWREIQVWWKRDSDANDGGTPAEVHNKIADLLAET